MQAARETGTTRLIHVSAMGAKHDSPSEFLRTKAAGEKAVLQEFPNATILRPSYMFGSEDNFLNTLATVARSLHVMPLLSGGTARMQPVYVSVSPPSHACRR